MHGTGPIERTVVVGSSAADLCDKIRVEPQAGTSFDSRCPVPVAGMCEPEGVAADHRAPPAQLRCYGVPQFVEVVAGLLCHGATLRVCTVAGGSARVAIARATAAMVAVEPTLEAMSRLSPSYLVEATEPLD
ncbi:hypothetical protein [Nocardia aobensis]|uniref:hypothetical protein n=1 Tax=Nocardia aobensis TaxID=257277 RepID=UPI0012F6E162|nr:hypothetical protein [Nocardia aobensis]